MVNQKGKFLTVGSVVDVAKRYYNGDSQISLLPLVDSEFVKFRK